MRWFTDNELHGRTLSPWNPRITPGGSSGGAGAAVATGIGPIAQGNDIAGSVRYPAYCCGVFGLRPSYGRVPSYNPSAAGTPPAIASQLMAVQGPLARNVADLRLAFEAMAVADPRDPRGVPIGVGPRPVRPIRVALVPRPGGGHVHPAVASAIDRAGRALASAGYAVEEIEPPGFTEAARLWQSLAMPDTIARLEPLVAAHGDAAIRHSLGLWRAVFPDRDPAVCLEALARRWRLARLWQEFFDRVPIVVAPVSLEPPFAIGTDVRDRDTTARLIEAQTPMLAVSVLGLPAIAAPIGMHDGVPVGVQIVGGPCREDLCFDAAAIVEAHYPMPTPIDPVNQ
jgi:amidase